MGKKLTITNSGGSRISCLGGGVQKSYFLKNKSWRAKKIYIYHQNSVKTLHLSKEFSSKLTRAERERKFLTIFQTFEWIFLQNIQKLRNMCKNTR